MPLNIIRNDISRVSADAIVNTANPLVAIGQGVDSTIYKAAGAEKLLAERAKIGPMQPGQAAATPAFDLDAKYIIHTVGPAWCGGDHGEYEAVASCYRESLRIADELGCESIAFPLISTGTYGFPKDKALKIAIGEISSFLFSHDMTVYMVVYDRESFVISSKAFADVKSYIEEREVLERESHAMQYMAGSYKGTTAGSYDISREDRRRRRALREARRRRHEQAPLPEEGREESRGEELMEDAVLSESLLMADAEMAPASPDTENAAYAFGLFDYDEEKAKDIEDVLKTKGETFQEMLFRIINRKGLTDPEVYKRANIDRKLFSKIRNPNYKPSKKTALALAIALELNLDETLDLLRRAEYALSPSSRFDLIVGYCITHKIYNIFEVNTFLFNYDEPLLVE